LIFTHGVWLNALDGYPVTYEPVTLGKSVWLPWRVFVMPGTTIGDGTVIGANSLVSGNIPPGSLAVGSPAKVIRSAPDFPRRLSDEQRVALVAQMMAEFDQFVRYHRGAITEEPPFRVYRVGGKSGRLLWLRGAAVPPDDVLRRGDCILAENALPEAVRAQLRARGAHWLNLGSKTRSRDGSPLTEELALYLGRYGIRLARDA
jgi:hypothetical protein